MAGCDEDMAERPFVPGTYLARTWYGRPVLEQETAWNRSDFDDSGLTERGVPPAVPTDRVHIGEELVDRRSVPIGHREQQRQQVAGPPGAPCGEPGKRVRAAVAVRLGAHVGLSDRGCARAPRGRGIGRVAEDDDVDVRVCEGRLRRQRRETRADDRDFVAVSH
jgi:hypothetical protein